MIGDDYTGRVVIYDHRLAGDRAGVVVDPRCTTCKRFCASAGTSVVYGGWDGNAESFEGWRCSRCGPFEPEILCWAGDL